METRQAAEERAVASRATTAGLGLQFQLFDRVRELWAARRGATVEVQPYEPGVTRLRPLLLRPALIGFVAVLAIFIGASQPSSPFTLTHVPGSWYFGIPPSPAVSGVSAPPGQDLFFGIALFYGGLALLLRAWYEVVRVAVRHPGIPVRKFVPVLVVWTFPLLFVAPLLSRDVYSYVAQGEMMSHGINPYSYGPAVLGVNSWVNMVDPLWQNVTSPYGPLFMSAAGAVVSLTGHNLLLSVIGMRLLAVAGVALIGIFLPRLARSYGYDGSAAFTLAVLNPIVLVDLIGGAHNDALMLGLMVAGLSLARSRRPIIGAVLVALATCIKVPAAIGLVYIGWEWLGDEMTWRERVRPMVSVLLVGGAVTLAVSEAVGLGWGWASALGNPDTLVLWGAPTTAVGLTMGYLVHGVGFGNYVRGFLTLSRGAGALAAGVIGVRLLFRSTTRTMARALGLTLLAVTLLSPVVQPWYVAWALVVLAAVADDRMRAWLVALSCVFLFLGIPGGWTLVSEVTSIDPGLLLAACVAVGGGALVFSGKLRRLVAGEDRERPRSLPEGSTI